MNVLITGAAGFIGSHLGNRLTRDGHSVQGIDNYLHASKAPLSFPCERADTRDVEYLAMRAKNADVIVHLAAAINIDNSIAFPEHALAINVWGTFNVLEVARRYDLPVVFASSSEVYGSVADGMAEEGIDEGHPLDGQSPYAASKIAGDRMCKAWSDTYGMRINVVRLFNTFGPFQADDGYGGVIAKFVRAAISGEPMTIFGDGSQRRDYLYVDDAVEAYVLAMKRTFGTPINFGSSRSTSILGLAKTIHTIAGDPHIKSAWKFGPPRPGEVEHLICDNAKARGMGWEPKVSLETGLARYVEWVRDDA